MSGPAESVRADPNGSSLAQPLLPPAEEDRDRTSVAVESHDIPVEDPALQVGFEEIPVDETWEHGQVQEAKCQDPFFTVLFLAQLATMLVLASFGLKELVHGDYAELDLDFDIHIRPGFHEADLRLGSVSDGSRDEDEDMVELDTLRYILFHVIVAAAGIGWGIGALALYGAFAQTMVKTSLLSSPLVFSAVAVWSFICHTIALGIVATVMALVGALYAYSVWHRIPFAAANLSTAMAAVRQNFGLVFLGFWTVVKTWIWTFAAALAMLYTYHHVACSDGCTTQADADDDSQDVDSKNDHFELLFFLMLLSYFWTYGVLKYMLHTNVAGVVGSWWFVPEEASACCSQALCDSTYRTSVYSIGSICFGALIISVTQVLQVAVRMARQDQYQRGRNSDNRRSSSSSSSVMFCVLEFIVNQLERLVQYVNKWAFVYVGIYGFDYLTAGSKVYQLFQVRGWSVLLNDILVSRGLQIVTVLISLFTGISSLGLYALVPTWWDGVLVSHDLVMRGDDDDTDTVLSFAEAAQSNSGIMVFALGCVYGAIFSSVLLKVVASAVETVVVCFAESPNALRENHPDHARKMVRSWRQVYPDEFGPTASAPVQPLP